MSTFLSAAHLMHWHDIIYTVFASSFFFSKAVTHSFLFPQVIFPHYFDGERKQAAFYDFSALINSLYELKTGEQPSESYTNSQGDWQGVKSQWPLGSTVCPSSHCAPLSWCNSGAGCHFFWSCCMRSFSGSSESQSQCVFNICSSNPPPMSHHIFLLGVFVFVVLHVWSKLMMR